MNVLRIMDGTARNVYFLKAKKMLNGEATWQFENLVNGKSLCLQDNDLQQRAPVLLRDENQVKVSLDTLAEETMEAGTEYYRTGERYRSSLDGRAYILKDIADGTLIFRNEQGYEMFIPKQTCGTFIPGIASEGFELYAIG